MGEAMVACRCAGETCFSQGSKQQASSLGRRASELELK